MVLVLIVDDMSDIRFAIKMGLESLNKGYVVSVSPSADEAMEIIPTLMPDVILMDVMMPGTDGLDATIKIKNDPSLAKIPIIILTAKIDKNTRGMGQVAADAFLPKPLDLQMLDETIQHVISK